MKNALASLLLCGVLLQGCYRILPSNGGGQLSGTPQERAIDPADVLLPEGYRIEAVASGLTFPTALTFDGNGTPYVIEAGYSYGEVFLQPRLLRIEADGQTTEVYVGTENGPWNGVTYHDGFFYIAEGGQLEGGKILRVSQAGEVQVLVEGLPSYGDHHTNGPLIQEGYVYFGQGTATNSGVVGNDNADFGWLRRHPDFHDIPCADITLADIDYTTPNVLTDDPNDRAVTGPYSPYNTAVSPRQVIKGEVPCTGAVLRVALTGGEPEVVAWGFRNPYGLATAPDGTIYVTQNAYDDRGSRPIWGTGDLLFRLEAGAWYGWPDYNGQLPLTVTHVPGDGEPRGPLVTNPPNDPPKPVATFGVHSSSNGLDFSTDEEFGFRGQAFVAQFGDMAPKVGKVLAPVGYKVVRVDVETGRVEDFVVNRGKKDGPASWLDSGGLERPNSVQFTPSGDALYIVDFGIMTMSKAGPTPREKTGVVWKVSKE